MNARAEHVIACEALVDAPVVNRDGEELGTLARVMLDLAAGRVAYALVAHGGVLGLGERLFAVPWQSLEHDAGADCFVLDMRRDEIADAFPVEAPTDL